jgi:predicted RNase H-like HicB family nuclease
MNAAPPGFLRPGDDDPFDTDALAVEFGWIDGYRIVYEQAPSNWAAYSPDVPGCISTGKTRQDVERNMREALAGHLALGHAPAPRLANRRQTG